MAKCRTCHGTGKVKCQACGGAGCKICGQRGFVSCPTCTARGRMGDLRFEVLGNNSADIKEVTSAIIREGGEHIQQMSKGQAALAGFQFEREVAAIYRTLGAKVEVDVGVAGNQIDILLKEKTSSGSDITVAVECKSYGRPVGVDAVVSFAAISQLLRQRGLIDRAVLVSKAGFTSHAREAAKEYTIELLELSDLLQRVEGKSSAVEAARIQIQQEQEAAQSYHEQRIFVVMPFAKEFEDVYLLGIREVAEKMRFIVERADDIEHNENILSVIRGKIQAANAVIGDTTGSNPNVFYEIGYAHALEVPTVLIARKGSSLPFDLQTENHILYETIVELRERLEKRLSMTLKIAQTDGPTKA